MSSRVLGAGLTLAALTVSGWWASRGIDRDLRTPRDLHEVDYVGSDDCRRCHEDHWASWRRTYHRTMTQDANAETVLGAFDGSGVTYFGWTARMTEREGEYFVTVEGPGGAHERAQVVRTVGSHRYQQYLARHQDVYWRLPVAWHVQEQRWVHMNGAFLTPDPETEAATRADFSRHVTRWNDNCVFCHNVAPNPGLQGERFATEVAELGIACEACHGPGAAHAERNANPFRRYALHSSDRPDPTIVSPERLDASRSAAICGRCHGQRKTDHLERFMREGDPFVPGDDLAHTSEPLWRDSTIDGEQVFTERFWGDGTARLTAYEYQGWIQSACREDDTFTCASCHSMHEGDPAQQMRPDATDGGCAPCHTMAPSHGRHTDVSCVDCHMPRVVYGLVDAHRSHRIEVPDPAAAERSGRPDACTLCHTDRTRAWASRSLESADAPVAPGMPEAVVALFGGDPIERSIAAAALGRSNFGRPREVRGLLLDVMEHDDYPAVRRIAFQALRRRSDPPPPWEAFRPATPRSERRKSIDALRAGLTSVRPDAALLAPLRERASTRAIEIGE